MADETEPGDEPPAEKPKYDQAFFLDLAAKGKNAWNAWRRDPANKDVYVTFAGADFSEVPKDKIDFTGFEFGDCADFSQCKWRGVDLFRAGATDIFKPGRACLPGASFGDRAKFEGATFNDFASFTGASFGDRASFTGTAFGQYASFTGGVVFGAQASFEFAAFDGAARFDAADFDAGVSFRGATFGEGASFQEAVIGSVSSFDGTAFGDWTFFDAAIFNGAVTFSGKSIMQWTGLFQLITHGFSPDARRALKKMHEQSWKINGSAPDRLATINRRRV
jgi:Pentapeptide repeats (9 copies)